MDKFPLYGNYTGNWFTDNLLMRVRPTKSIKFARDHFQKHWHGKEWKFVHYTWCEWHNRREQVKAESSKEQSESPSRSVIVILLLLLGCNPQQTFLWVCCATTNTSPDTRLFFSLIDFVQKSKPYKSNSLVSSFCCSEKDLSWKDCFMEFILYYLQCV